MDKRANTRIEYAVAHLSNAGKDAQPLPNGDEKTKHHAKNISETTQAVVPHTQRTHIGRFFSPRIFVRRDYSSSTGVGLLFHIK